jgi:hypothetical protein
MKKLLVVLGLLVLASCMALAQVTAATYYVDYYANNAGPAGTFDQIIRIVNVGSLGTPLTWPARGGICANIYVFDPDQEMIACCSEPISPNELDSAYVGKDLTFNTLTTFIPNSGVVKITLTPNPGGAFSTCQPTNPVTASDATLAAVWGTHLQEPGGNTLFVTETEKHHQNLGADEAAFLPQACSFVLYLGSGRGTCRSRVSTGQF